jgi:integrase
MMTMAAKRRPRGPEGVYKTCHCRAEATTDPVTGKRKPGRLLGQECPERGTKGHTRWYARYDVPTADGKRRQVRAGPFDHEEEAAAARRDALTEKASGRPADDKNILVRDYLDRWLNWKVTGPDPLKPSTAASYAEAISLYFKPAIGHHKLGDLREQHLQKLYRAMKMINTPAEEGSRDEYLRRMSEARASWHGRRTSTRPLTDARIRRVHAVLRAALNDADIPYNPAARMQKKMGKPRKVKPKLWTEPRIAAWRKTGEVPGKVMVWDAPETGAFLDAAEGDRLYSLYHVAAATGMRRSELAGLAWSEVDLANLEVHVTQAQVETELDSTKSEDSDRIIAIDGPPADPAERDNPARPPSTAEVLKAWRTAQRKERMAWGPGWQDSGRVFTREDGSPLRAEWVSEHFGTLARRAGLPPIRFHDLRHAASTAELAAGIAPKVVSERRGHATVAFTMDVYTNVVREQQAAAATASADYMNKARAAR